MNTFETPEFSSGNVWAQKTGWIIDFWAQHSFSDQKRKWGLFNRNGCCSHPKRWTLAMEKARRELRKDILVQEQNLNNTRQSWTKECKLSFLSSILTTVIHSKKKQKYIVMLCYDNSIRPSSLNSSYPRPRWINIPIYQNKKCRKIYWYCNNYSWLNKTLMAFEIDPPWSLNTFRVYLSTSVFHFLNFIGYSYKSIPFRTFHLFFSYPKISFLAFFIPWYHHPNIRQIHRLMVQSSQCIFHIFQRLFWNPKLCLSSDSPKSWGSTIKKPNGNGWCFRVGLFFRFNSRQSCWNN